MPEKTRGVTVRGFLNFNKILHEAEDKNSPLQRQTQQMKDDNLEGRFHTWIPWCLLFWLQRLLIFVYNIAEEQVALIVKAWNSEYSDTPLDLILYSEV